MARSPRATSPKTETGETSAGARERDELFDKKIELAEQRIETRLVAIESKLDRVLDRLNAAVEASERAGRSAERAEERADEARRAAGTVLWNIVVTGLAVAGILFVAWALWAQGVQMVADLVSLFSQQGG
jgi:hypothetical protein